MLNEIKYNRIIKRIDLREVLLHLGINYQEKGDELVFVCPGPRHVDTIPSCTLNFNPNSEKYTWFSCFGCGYSGKILKLIADIEEISLEEAMELIIGFDNGTDNFKKKRRFKHTVIRSKRRVRIKLPNSFCPLEIGKHSAYLQYLLQRGVVEEDIVKYGWGFCATGSWRKRVVLPVFMNRKLVNCYGRHISSTINRKKKHKNSWLAEIERIVFPYDELDFDNKTIWVTESVFNLLKLKRLGVKNVVCLFGNRLTDWKIKFLNLFGRVNLVPDGDEGGDFLVSQCVLKLKCVISTVDMVRGEDVGSVKLSKMKEILVTLHPAKVFPVRCQADYLIE